MKDYYHILGLQPGADSDSIHKAFRTRAKIYHPDLNNSADAYALFIQLNEAHDVLSDESKRIAYDQRYLSWKGSSAAHGFHYDWESMNRMRHHTGRKARPASYSIQFVFGLEMFLGFTETLLILGAIFHGSLHPVYVVFGIPGVLLVIDGWKGIVGRKSLLTALIKKIKSILHP